MSRYAKDQGCTVIVHGSDPADHIEKYVEHGADFIIAGEGEVTLLELVAKILSRDGTSLDAIHGIAYRPNGSIYRSDKRELLTDLDLLPFPARQFIDTEKYRQLWKRQHGYFSMNMVTTRGCPFHCNWCAKPIYGQVYHTRSPENVVEEMLLLKREFKPDHIWFCDDIFGLTPGWAQQFADIVNRDDIRMR